MKKIYFNIFLALAVGVGFSCENKREADDDHSATTEEVGSSADTGIDDENVGMESTTDPDRITTGNPPVPVFTTDQEFVALAASSGMLEVDLGKVASDKATNADVKKFGQEMVTDHTKANEELKALANQKKWAVPAYMSANDKEVYDRISKLSGQQFDRDYMAQMVTDHEKAITIFEQATRQTSDADLKAFTSKVLPTLRHHLDMARTLNDKVRAM